ncbi:alanyl-tRNA editing protein [Mesobacillus foraminis]|uniref:Alanyl-tRNA synthetase n=1 Tax=Mesobacillus foraminis TaxID=279826 RepID=A0A4V6NKQ9_9BACI|nr:DHHA1 domain-containing protein [Mesobacillus foraminis]TCN25110.1 alanyl-tRNA synthetase [Mesobacillus foraminis]
MTTEKLYYQGQYIRDFKTSILKQGKDEKGTYAVLEQTAFYPTGGGQPHDTGTLNGVRVMNVEETDGEIRHYLESPLQEQEEYRGEIDWDRRFDHMQQHAGQHILSAAFEEAFGYKTVSFHLGNKICTIDLEVPRLTDEETIQAEKLANTIILENRPIEAKWVSESELSNYNLRKKLSVTDHIRLVIIPDFDYNGCGGTHPSSTGQVSSIKILDWEKQKKIIRVQFVCGSRVIKQLHEKQKVLQGLTAILNAPQDKMEEAASRVLQQARVLEKTVEELKGRLIEHEAGSLLNQAETIDGRRTIQAHFEDRPITELQQMARTIAATASDTLVLFINETPEKLQIICAKGTGLAFNMNQLLKKVLPAINGKGGGNDSFAQGGGDKLMSPQQVMEELLNSLE